MKNEILYMIGLNLIPRIGPKLAKKLIAHCGGAEGVLKYLPVFCRKSHKFFWV